MNERIIGGYSFSNFQLFKKKRGQLEWIPFLCYYQFWQNTKSPFMAETKITFQLAKSVGNQFERHPQQQTTTKTICLAKSCGNPSPDKHGYKLEYCPGTFKTYNETYGFGKGHPYQVLVSMLHFRASVTCDCGSNH